MAHTGGGHLACADALQSAFRERAGSRVSVDAVDLWSEEAPWPLNEAPRAYRPLVMRTPRFWRTMYAAGQRPRVARRTFDIVWCWTRGRARAALQRYRPTLVVSVHALLQDTTLRVLSEWRRREGIEVPFFTVVADLVSVPPVWFQRGAALCFVPTDEARRRALRAGMDRERIRLHGLPIRPGFSAPRPADDVLKRRLGLAPDLPLVLVIGGGEGMGKMEETASALAARLAAEAGSSGKPLGQVGLICGRNRRLRERLDRRTWPLPVAVAGYVENLWDWVAASEFVITKAGPNTIMEACASGVPLLISGYVPGQEEGNVRYVVENGAGAYAGSPERIAEVASRWLGPGRDQLDDMARRARGLGRPGAALRIVDDILERARLMQQD